MSKRELAGFFDLVEKVGCVRLPAATLTDSVSLAAASALRAERILVDGTPAEALPCKEGGACTREVRDVWEGRGRKDPRKRWLAVCGEEPAECEDAWLADHEVRTMVVRLPALVQTTAYLFGVTRVPADLPAAWGAPGEPRAIGVCEPREVFLSLRPERELTSSWLALRERAARAALVIVPTTRRISAELTARHGPMDRVEIVALADAVTLKDGALALSVAGAGLRVLGPERAKNDVAGGELEAEEEKPKKAATKAPMRKARGLALPPIKKWRDLRVCLVNPTTVRLDGGGKYARFTAAQLGLASTTTLRPTRAWLVLAMTCDHGGLFNYKKFDKRWPVVRRCVSDLGVKMQELFGIEEPPFERPWDGMYRSKFVARVGVPKGEDENQ
jgi:hypothetical protein